MKKSLISNSLAAISMVFGPQMAALPLLLVASAAIAEQGLNPDPVERWKSWQSAGDATVRTPQLRDGNVYRLTPAEIIYYSGVENRVNPVLLLVKMQHEQGLLATASGDAAALQRRLDRAAGFGIFDSDPDHTKWAGFYPQLVAASYQFGSLWKRTYRSSADAIAHYSTDLEAGKKVATIYLDYADKMNRIAGKRYPTAPGGWGHVDDFQDISPVQIQAFLELFPGNLKNRSLFGGTSIVNGPKAINQPAIPGQIQKDQRLAFAVQTDRPVEQVKITFQNPLGEAFLSGSGTQWMFDRPITVAGSRPWMISVMVGGKVSDEHLRGTLNVVGNEPSTGGGGTPVSVAMPLSPMPGMSQSFGNKLNYKTSACYFVGYHTGVDYAPVAAGQGVSAIAEGQVVKTGQIGKTPNALGSYVVVEHPALGIRSYYLHVVPAVGVGTKVSANQKIATIAATTAVGKHLHLEIQKNNFKIVDSNGASKLFVGHNTTPMGSCGYLSRQSDLSKGWVNPAEFLKQPTVQAGASQHQADHEDIDVEDFPQLSEQKTRTEVVGLFLNELAKRNHKFAGTLDEQARAAGLITSASLVRPQDTATRMEVALLAHRLLQKFAPAALGATPASAFPIEEFKDTPDVVAQEYQRAVNALAAAGVVTGSRDANGELRFFPTRKASASEVQAFVERTMSKIGASATAGAKIVNAPSIAASIDQNGQLAFTVNTDKPADKVVMVFQNPDAQAPLAGSGTRFTFDRPITVAGNRPWKLRVYVADQVTDEHLTGTLAVRPTSGGNTGGGATTPLQPWQQTSLNYVNSYLEGRQRWTECWDAGSGRRGTYCYRFARQAVGLPAMGSAIDAFESLLDQGRASTAGFDSAPVGSLVFYRIGSYGHVAVKVSATEVAGHGNELAFTANCPPITRVSHASLIARSPYAGFYAPGGGAVTLDPNIIATQQRVLRQDYLAQLKSRIRDSRLSDGFTSPLSEPSRPITRGEAALLLGRALVNLPPKLNAAAHGPLAFGDAGGGELAQMLNELSARDIVQGQANELAGGINYFPNRQLSRSEADALLTRASALLATKQGAGDPASVNITSISASPSVVQAGQAMTFSAAVDNAGDVQRAELVFPDAGVIEPMAQSGNTFTRQRTMTTAGSNRPFEVRIYKKSTGQTVTRQGTYSVQVPQPVVVPVNITAISANPSAVQAGQAMTFSAAVDNASDVQRAELVFPDAGVIEPMTQSGNTFMRQRTMTTAGSNRPFEVRIYKKSTGQTVTRQGSYSVQAAQPVVVPVNITAIGASPSAVRVGQSMTFSAAVDNASDVQRAELVFPDAGVIEPMTQSGNTFMRQRQMGSAGYNRPFEVRIYKRSTGQAVTRSGTFTVQ